MHEGGFGAERGADGTLRFSRPDGRVIDGYPQLPDVCDIDALRGPICAARGKPIDATDWIIPEGAPNLDLAVSGLRSCEQASAAP